MARHLLRPAVLTALCLSLLSAPGVTAARAVQPPRGSVVATAGVPAPTVYTGAGFDTCAAPPLETMRAWSGGASPYGAVGIYISGSQRHCKQPALDADWVSQVRALGWRLLPMHVGRQPPCSDRAAKQQTIDPAHATEQGTEEAAESVAAAQALGLGQGTPVYLDLEAYPKRTPECAKAITDFTIGWTQGLHSAGYLSGFYSSVLSGVADLVAARRAGAAPMPDAVYYARWDGRAVTDDGGGKLHDDEWSNHQRAHQYQGNVQETHGGATLAIDQIQLDTAVAP